MLPTDLLMNRINGETIVPKRLDLEGEIQTIAADLIEIFKLSKGSTRAELSRHLLDLEGEETDYRVKRGLAHLLSSAFSEFEIVAPLDPIMLREKVFAAAAQTVSSPVNTAKTLHQIAEVLSQELDREVLPEQVKQGLYADLPDNQILTQFTPPTPEALIHRYNLSQVQGIFYRATDVRIDAHRNEPGEYKLLFRYSKLFQLMSYIEGDADHGFTLTIDGPTSLFSASTRYGLALAKLLPALLHVTKWTLTADLQTKDFYSGELRKTRFTLESDCGLVSHYPPGKTYDSMLEEGFVDRWNKTKTEWKLEREVDLIAIPGSVMIPDFRLVHPDGRSYLFEIVGYWRPEYLRKKFAQVRKADRDDLILAVSERLNLEKAGVKMQDVPTNTIWFKNELLPKSVLALLD